MIAFFPEIYPDELLYSQIARYHRRSGYARYVYTAADIYNNEKTVYPNLDFVNRYTSDAMQWIAKDEPWEVIAEQHTMYPAYIRFLPKLRRIEAVKGILSCEGNWKNLMCIPVRNEERYIRYCPKCAEEDRDKYGETYWHREHQIPRIRVCPKHRCFLENSEIIVSANKSPNLYDAETNVPKKQKIRECHYGREIEFTKYVVDVMHEPIDMENNISIGKFLHSHLNDNYVNKSGLVRNISKMYAEYKNFYGEELPIMTLSYMQKIFNGYVFDTFFVLQIAYFLNINIQDITHMKSEGDLHGIEKVYQELSNKYNLEYAVIEEIGSSILNYSYNQNRVTGKLGNQKNRYDEIDAEYLPKVKKVVNQIIREEKKPEKVSFSKVQKMLGLPDKQLNNLPLCKAYIIEHIESQPEYWARKVEWAVNELSKKNKPINMSRIVKLTNMKSKDVECCHLYIKKQEVRLLIEDILK